MDLKQLMARAAEVRRKYDEGKHREWGNEQIMQGLVGDIGDLAKFVMEKEGWRKLQTEVGIEHELADVLWCILVLANNYGVDLEKEFMKTMDELEERIDKKLPH